MGTFRLRTKNTSIMVLFLAQFYAALSLFRRFVLDGGTLEDSNPARIVVKPKKTFQKIVGFGGAFTDAAGINIKSLSPAARERLLESYFGENGKVR